jgi:NMD protein affecting ribosome stability and mRNA decay
MNIDLQMLKCEECGKQFEGFEENVCDECFKKQIDDEVNEDEDCDNIA